MSIVLIAILAVMWVAFLLPVIALRQPGGAGWLRRRLGRRTDDAGWRPTADLGRRGAMRSGATARRAADGRTGTSTGRSRRGARGPGRSVLRRRRVLLGLTLAAAVSVRVRYVLGGRWWVAEAVTAALLGAYVVALVVRGYRRRHPPRRALPAPPERRALTPPSHPAAVVVPALVAPPGKASSLRRRRWCRRRQPNGPLWGTPLLEGQGPPGPE